MHIFIAAPFTGVFDGSQNLADHGLGSFLIALIEELESSGHSVFSAHRREQFGRNLWPANLCTAFDRVEMQLADCVIAYPADSYGVHMELGWASALTKPMLVITDRREMWRSPLVAGLPAIARSEVFVSPPSFPETRASRDEMIAASRRWVASLTLTTDKRARYGIFTCHGSHGHSTAMAALARTLRQHHISSEIHAFTLFRNKAPDVCDCVVEIDTDNEHGVRAVHTVIQRYDALFSIGESLLVDRWRGTAALHVRKSNRAWMRTANNRLIDASLAEVSTLVRAMSADA